MNINERHEHELKAIRRFLVLSNVVSRAVLNILKHQSGEPPTNYH